MNYIDILRGDFGSLINQRSKTIKIFLSSTFSDTHSERDFLIKNIYPKLREYCQQSYGLDFQIYDMRWGISNEITSSHMTTTVCLNEIQNCQNSSVGPNFIAFLSHRYGSRSLPTRVKANEYEILLKELNSSNDYDKTFNFDDEENKINFKIENMLELCYELDDNETPARYRLKHIDKIIQNFKENDSILNRAWSKLEKKLGNLFRALAESCLKKNLITPVEHERYFVSVTEKEIFNEVRNLLDELKYKKIPSKLPESNMFKFKVKWDSKSGISLDTHRKYIEKFAETFYEQVKKLIDVNYEQQKEFDNLSHEDHELIQEVIDHACFCNETVSKFHGRADILEKYLLDTSNNIPYVLYGESGCGKTAILAKITSEIFKIVPDPENYCVLLRFLGTTPISSDIIKTFQSLMRQLCIIFNIRRFEFKSRNEIESKNELESLLDFISQKFPMRKIVIILDSIDQLNTCYYNLNWLFTKLNQNVKIIYSTLPAHGNILQNLKNKIDEKNFNEIFSLDAYLAKEIVLDWLGKIGRQITNKQLYVLGELFEYATLYPLYVKLIFDIVSKWTSFYEPDDEFKQCLNIDSSIQYIFLYLEKIHGKLLFSRAIIYMSLFKNGISENEIEDILSLDDDVLYDIFEFHAPPIRKLPIALWARIKNDLKGYMVEKEIDDTRVIYWYHRRFIEVANTYYVSKLTETDRTSLFSNVVDFFNETWKNKPKPYKYNEYLAKKFGVDNSKNEEIRDTGMQPTIFIEPSGKVRYNKRKITELPQFIAKLSPNLALPLICELVYFDLNFLTGLFYLNSFTDIYKELSTFSSQSSYAISKECKDSLDEVKFFELCILQCGLLMKDNLEAILIHFLSRTLNFYRYFKHFTKLIDQYYNWIPAHYPLVLVHQYLDPPMGELLFEFDKHVMPINHFLIGGEDNSLILTMSNKICAFNLDDLNELGEVKIGHFESEIFFFSAYLEDFEQAAEVLKDLEGGLILCSQHEMKILNYDSTVKFLLKNNEKKFSKSYALTSEIFVIFYESENLIEFYNITTSENIDCMKFDRKIKATSSQIAPSEIYLIDQDEEKLFVVCLDDNEIIVFSVVYLAYEKEIEKKILQKIPSITMPVNSLKIFMESRYNSHTYTLVVTFEQFGFYLFESYAKLEFLVYCEKDYFNLKILDFKNDRLLFSETNKSLLLFYNNDKLCKISGYFTDAILSGENELVASEREKVYVFSVYFSEKDLKFQISKLASFDAHFDEINSLYVENQILFTTSKDLLLRIYSVGSAQDFTEFKLDFHKASKEIEKLISLRDEHLIAKMQQSNQLHVWNKTNGKIEFNIILDPIEIIEQIKCSASKTIVVSKLDDKTYRIRYYSIKINEKISLEEKMRRDLTNIDEIKVEYDADRDDLFFLVVS
ncbi:NACHT and WD repeat domain-containing 2-like, partial [Brachionus plicatilis]